MIKRILIPFTLLFSALSFGATSGALAVDRAIPSSTQLAFPNDAKVFPEISDFTVLSVIPMSNDAGERFAVATIKNQAHGRRTLTHKHLLALTAEGKRIKPMQLSTIFDGQETLSLTLSFGESKFPLLSVYTRN